MAGRQVSLAARVLGAGAVGSLAAGVLLLSGCGQKGPLTLPQSPAAASAPAASAPR
ncbi:MAG TPA: lipoprotein [Rhizobacter sp.]